MVPTSWMVWIEKRVAIGLVGWHFQWIRASCHQVAWRVWVRDNKDHFHRLHSNVIRKFPYFREYSQNWNCTYTHFLSVFLTHHGRNRKSPATSAEYRTGHWLWRHDCRQIWCHQSQGLQRYTPFVLKDVISHRVCKDIPLLFWKISWSAGITSPDSESHG